MFRDGKDDATGSVENMSIAVLVHLFIRVSYMMDE